MDDNKKLFKLEQLLENVELDDLIQAVELFKETAQEADDPDQTGMTSQYVSAGPGGPILNHSL